MKTKKHETTTMNLMDFESDKGRQRLVETMIGPLEKWSHQCHAASLNLVRSGLLGESRVARGSCVGVGGQHSWAVLGKDCYDMDAVIIDVTAWSYGMQVPKVWVTSMRQSNLHRPHGWSEMGIMEWGCPESGGGKHIELTPTEPLSAHAKFWIDVMFRPNVGRLDRTFWANLANHTPLNGWPAAEIFKAMSETEEVAALIPIDKLGMLTDTNPDGLYF